MSDDLAIEVCHDLINRAMRAEAGECTAFDERAKEQAIRTLIAERDAYRSALADMVMWTHPDKRDAPHMETVRIRARDLLKNGPVRP